MMKKKTMTLLMAAMMLSSMAVFAQKNDKLYLTAAEVPDAVSWLPKPPAAGSSQFINDISQYFWGMEQRKDSVRAKMAIRHTATKTADIAVIFSEAFGMEISEEKTPAIYKFLDRGVRTIRLSATKPKAHYFRTRPYVYFDQPTLFPQDEEIERKEGAYPSGHTIRGWGMALMLCEINPDAQNEIFKLGYEYGQSRVICGYHWQSDVDASRMLAAACFARLHTCKEFLEDLADAQEEFQELKGTTVIK